MVLSDMGKIAHEQWFLSAKLRTSILMRADEFVVMPTHAHGIIEILNNVQSGKEFREGFGQPVARSIPTIVRAYKSAVTYQINAIQNSKAEMLEK